MKRSVMAFLFLLVLPFVLSAVTSDPDAGISAISTTSKEAGVLVELDYSKSVLNGTNVAFSKKAIEGTDFLSYKNVVSSEAFPLNIFRDAGAGIVAESGDAYLCWQIYTPHSVDIKMYMNSALSNGEGATLNWFFTVDGENYGYSGIDVFDYGNNSSACTSIIASVDQYTVGSSGCKKFTISTQPLDPSAVGKPYTAFLYAEISTK